ncbi:HEXXH motif-containing putative peptide modification protein [Pseudomonas sp. 91RF]|uniref:aKG-HExxH-type peptide beta-hydroxylase n=1 Tax=Pseudomonas sp. 91RF TaxID=2292261 RepID=UPI002114079F|nr:HEXXH motif-containing putative peptide modification protein [Pseudomonas sp. 91RF]
MLLEHVSRNRFTVFMVLYAELFKLFSGESRLSVFFDRAVELVLLPPREQALIINDPVFQIWTGQAFRSTNQFLVGKSESTAELEKTLLEFPEMLDRVKARSQSGVAQNDPPVYRFDVDPLIMQATPPSYEFPEDEATRKRLELGGVSSRFFADVVKIALLRIEHTWPACREQMKFLIKSICYLPDGSFRSCSASRYTGVILLASRDDSILDLEESLVHEATHQLLYHVVEVSAIVDPDASQEASFSLPWSGQKRDLYGYFHAFYVYIALVKYMERVRSRSDEELQRAQNRLLFILRGLIRALPDLQGSEDFTPHGRQLLENLAAEVRAMESKYAGRLAAAAPLPTTPPVLGATA